jgi:pimeloyl-ACP methyl ester carboxylesterase/DNA-binding CsgD family transcriptional regulator
VGRVPATLGGMDPRVAYARTTDDVSIAYTSVGRGPTLVIMPGVPFSDFAAEWRIPVLRRAFEGLAAHIQVVHYDGRGTGHSQRHVDDLSLEARLRDLDAVVGALQLTRFALLGFYNSCTHAIAFAARHPDKVTRIAFFGGSARGWSPMSAPGTQALLSLIERDWDTFVESIAHAWLGWSASEHGRLATEWFRSATTPAVARATLEIASGIDVSDDLPRVTCPALVLHRTGGTVITRSMSDELAAGLPNGRLHLLDGESAGLFFEHTDDVVRDLVTFVTGDGPERPPAGRSSRPRRHEPGDLTPRELEVLRLLAGGESNAEIARRLAISIHTVERHVVNLYRKIDARGRADATAYAVRRGLA